MNTTIDGAGRLVVPKPIRERLGLKGGEVVEVLERDGRIEIELVPTPMRLKQTREGPVVVVDGDMPPLTDESVRETIERIRR